MNLMKNRIWTISDFSDFHRLRCCASAAGFRAAALWRRKEAAESSTAGAIG